MKRKYIKMAALLLTVFAFFSGIDNVKADCNDDNKIFSLGDCKYYGKINQHAYRLELHGGDCDFGGLKTWGDHRVKANDGDDEATFQLYDNTHDVKTLREDYKTYGCPVAIYWTTDRGTVNENVITFSWYKKGNISDVSAPNDPGGSHKYIMYWMSDAYFDSKTNVLPLDEPGVNVQIEEFNENMKPMFESLYSIYTGTDASTGANTYEVEIQGQKKGIKLYNLSKDFGYADVISEQWQPKEPTLRNDIHSTIGYNTYSNYLGVNNMGTLKSASDAKLKEIATWAVDALNAYDTVGTIYDDGEKIVKELKKSLGKNNALYKWGTTHGAIPGERASKYSNALEILVQGANSGKDKWSWNNIGVKYSDNKYFHDKANDSVKKFAKYLQFNVEITKDGDNTNLLTIWFNYLENDLASFGSYVSSISETCDVGYDIAKERKNSELMGYFKECKTVASKTSKHISNSGSKYRTTINSLKSGGFNWREKNVVVTCENLLGDDVISMISRIYFVIEIVVVLLCVVLSMMDFFKATANSDADALKKTWTRVIKRIIVIFVLFLLPVLVRFALYKTGVISQVNDVICINL